MTLLYGPLVTVVCTVVLSTAGENTQVPPGETNCNCHGRYEFRLELSQLTGANASISGPTMSCGNSVASMYSMKDKRLKHTRWKSARAFVAGFHVVANVKRVNPLPSQTFPYERSPYQRSTTTQKI